MSSASTYKAEGNAAFAKKDWKRAIDAYSKALELESGEASAALLSNRSATYVFLQEFDKGALSVVSPSVLTK
jgi:stress-induced-phosphoprotein 1